MVARPSLLGTRLSIALHNWPSLPCNYIMVWFSYLPRILRKLTLSMVFIWMFELFRLLLQLYSARKWIEIHCNDHCELGKINCLWFCQSVGFFHCLNRFLHHWSLSLWVLSKWQEFLQRRSRLERRIYRVRGSRCQEQGGTRRRRTGSPPLTAVLLQAAPVSRFGHVDP